MPYNRSLENLLPKHLWTPQLRNQLRLGNSCVVYSFECDEFSVPSSIPATSSSISSIVDAAIDDKHIKECLSRTKMDAREHRLHRYTMDDDTTESGVGVSRMAKVTSNSKKSIYRGVIKVNDERFEAFVWDNTTISTGKTAFIGGYPTEIEAARAHDLVSIKLYGLHTITNLPVGCYGNEIYEMQTMNKNDFIIKVRWKGKGNNTNTGSHTPYRGVYRIQDSRSWGAWLSQEDNDFPKIFLGTYYTAEDAARAHDVAQIKFKGMDAIINFELSSYDIKTILYSNAKSPTAKKVPTYNDILMNKVSSEALSSPSNTFFESQPLKLTLSNTSMSTFCGNNPHPSGFKLGGGTGLSQARASLTNAINGNNTSFSMLFPSHGSQESQTQTMKLNPTMHQYMMKKRSYNEASSSNSFPNEQPLNKQMRILSNNFFSFQSNPSISGAIYPNQGANVEQPLTENNSSSTLDISQNHNLMQSSSYNLGGLTGTGSMVGTNDNSIVDNGAMIPNQVANVEQPLTQNNPNDLGLGNGQDFQSPTQAQNNQLDDIINSEFYQYILDNNHALLQNPNLSFSDCNLPELPSDFEIQLPPLVGTDLQGIEAEATATQEQYDAGIFLNDQSFPQSPGLNLVHHDGNQNLDLQNDLTSNLPSENSPKSSFSTSFLNLHSEINTDSTSLNQVLEYLENTPDLCPDPNTSNESFQNLISETNTSSHGNMIMTEKQDGLDTTQCVSNFDDLFNDPISETNTGSQIPTPGSQNDLNISDYLSDCYAVEEEADWIHHFGSDFGQQ